MLIPRLPRCCSGLSPAQKWEAGLRDEVGLEGGSTCFCFSRVWSGVVAAKQLAQTTRIKRHRVAGWWGEWAAVSALHKGIKCSTEIKACIFLNGLWFWMAFLLLPKFIAAEETRHSHVSFQARTRTAVLRIKSYFSAISPTYYMPYFPALIRPINIFLLRFKGGLWCFFTKGLTSTK